MIDSRDSQDRDTDLCLLNAEANYDGTTNFSHDFYVKNSSFYPAQSRSVAME